MYVYKKIVIVVFRGFIAKWSRIDLAPLLEFRKIIFEAFFGIYYFELQWKQFEKKCISMVTSLVLEHFGNFVLLYERLESN